MADKLLNVASYQFLQQAELAKMRLDAEGIPAFVADSTLVTNDWFLGNAVGYIKLQVPASQALRAKAILVNAAAEERAAASDDHDRCLECGALLAPGQHVCHACGWSYADSDSDSEAEADDDENEAAMEPESSDETSAGSTTLDSLRKLRRPIMLLLLAPLFAAAVALLAALVELALQALR